MFSVVIPLYNKELSITNTIQSVLNQTFQAYEIVIVNDGSTDCSVKKVKQFNDKRIRLIHQKNQGVSSARNRGIKEAKYNWIAFLDGDDLWSKKYLQSIYSKINIYPHELVFCSGYATLDNNYNLIRCFSIKEEDVLYSYFKTFNYLKRTIVHTSAMVVNKKALLKIGMFNEKLTHGEDGDCWIRLSKDNNFVVNSDIVSFYRIQAENRSNLYLPKLEKTMAYNIDSSSLYDPEEIKYYKNIVLTSLYASLKILAFKRFIKIKKKHNQFVKYSDLIKYILHKFRNTNKELFILRFKDLFSNHPQRESVARIPTSVIIKDKI